jgi:hypothetical protein
VRVLERGERGGERKSVLLSCTRELVGVELEDDPDEEERDQLGQTQRGHDGEGHTYL